MSIVVDDRCLWSHTEIKMNETTATKYRTTQWGKATVERVPSGDGEDLTGWPAGDLDVFLIEGNRADRPVLADLVAALVGNAGAPVTIHATHYIQGAEVCYTRVS